MGKAILGFLPLDEAHALLCEQPLQRYAPDTILDIREIEKELRKVRSQGYATISNELTAGKSSIAAPIRDRSRKIIGAVSISGSISQMDLLSKEKALAKMIIGTASKISGKMGYFPK